MSATRTLGTGAPCLSSSPPEPLSAQRLVASKRHFIFHVSAMTQSPAWLREFRSTCVVCIQDEVSGPSIAAPGLQLSLAPHEGRLRLISAGMSGRQAILHFTTRGQRMAPPPPQTGQRWELDFDDSGMGYLQASLDDEVDQLVWAEDLLAIQMCTSPSGRMAVVKRNNEGHVVFAAWFDEYRLVGDAAHLRFSVLGGQVDVNWRVVVQRVPRDGCRLFVGVYDFVACLSLHCVDKEKNKSHFVYKRFARWQKVIVDSLGLGDHHLVRSAPYKNATGRGSEDPMRQAPR